MWCCWVVWEDLSWLSLRLVVAVQLDADGQNVGVGLSEVRVIPLEVAAPPSPSIQGLGGWQLQEPHLAFSFKTNFRNQVSRTRHGNCRTLRHSFTILRESGFKVPLPK